mgnify:CR=1 FL=1
MNVNKIATFRLEHYIHKLMRDKGIPKRLIEEIPLEFASRKPEEGVDYYYYSGPLDDKTRPFCKQMLTYDKVVSEVDLDILSNYLDYDVKKYKGSYNCRHNWVKFRGKRISTPELTTSQIRKLISKGIQG